VVNTRCLAGKCRPTARSHPVRPPSARTPANRGGQPITSSVLNLLVSKWQATLKVRTFVSAAPLTGKPLQNSSDLQMRSGVLIGISSGQRSAICGHLLPERTDFGPALCGSTDPPMSQPAAESYFVMPTFLSCSDLWSLFPWQALSQKNNNILRVRRANRPMEQRTRRINP